MLKTISYVTPYFFFFNKICFLLKDSGSLSKQINEDDGNQISQANSSPQPSTCKSK